MAGTNGPADVVVGGVMESYRWVRDFYTAVKHGQVKPFTPLERKVREATRNEPWGPTGTMLNELAEISFDEHDCYVIFAVVDFRLGCPPEKWRNVYKALTVLDFILKRGSETWVTLTTNELLPKLSSLEEFEFIDEKGKDQGINVRHKAAAIRAILSSPRVLQAERESAKKKRQQYKGYARSDSMPAGRRRSDDGQTSGKRNNDMDDDWDANEDIGYGRLHANGNSLSHGKEQQSGRSAAAPSPARCMPRGQNAGEMKGVTLEDNKRNLAELRKILDRPENRQCADCAGASSSRPTWASINNGVFICMQCAGIHRGLGVHISQVRSCTLDTWLPHQISFLGQTGNAIANSYWEGKMPPGSKPTSGDSHALSSFIRRKYSGEWCLGMWPPQTGDPEPTSPQPAVAPQEPSTQGPQAQAGSFWGNFQQEAALSPAFQRSASAVSPTAVGFEDDIWGAFSDNVAVAPPAAAAAAPPAAKVPSQSSTLGSMLGPAPPAQPAPAPVHQSQQLQQPQPARLTTKAAAGGGSFWDSAPVAPPPPVTAPRVTPPQPQPQPQTQLWAAAAPAPTPVQVPAPAPAPSPVMFDLLSFDDVSQAPGPSQPPVQAPMAEMDLLNLFDSPALQPVPVAAVHQPPVIPAQPHISLLPPPTVPLYSENSQPRRPAAAPLSTDLAAIQELASSPANLMDAPAVFSPMQSPAASKVAAPAASAGPGGLLLSSGYGTDLAGPPEGVEGLDFKYEVQQTGSIVHGLDDLLNYQYTGADYRPNTRLQAPAPMRNGPSPPQWSRPPPAASPSAFSLGGPASGAGSFWGAASASGAGPAGANLARAGLGSGGGPMAGGRRPAGPSGWQQPQPSGAARSAGVTAFSALQDDFLGAYNLSPQRGSKPSNKPMRAG